MGVRVVQAYKIDHDTKGDKQEEIEIANERLHANGVFSNVYQAQLTKPQQVTVAVKKTWPHRNSAENREITVLRKLKHWSIVSLLYYFKTSTADTGQVCVQLVFEFLPTTIHAYHKQCQETNVRICPLETKLWSFQMFAAVGYLASRNLIHRDIKPQNLLLEPATHIVKLADFGSAKFAWAGEKHTTYQVTRYYRAPELIIGNEYYGVKVDVWAVGCVFAQLLKGRTLFPGRDNKDMLFKIMSLLGTPTPQQIRAMRPDAQIPNWPPRPPKPWSQFIPDAAPEALDLLSQMLRYEPDARLSASQACAHAYFDQLKQDNIQMDDGRPLPLSSEQLRTTISSESTSTEDSSSKEEF